VEEAWQHPVVSHVAVYGCVLCAHALCRALPMPSLRASRILTALLLACLLTSLLPIQVNKCRINNQYATRLSITLIPSFSCYLQPIRRTVSGAQCDRKPWYSALG